VNALNNGTLDFASLSEADQEQLRLFNVPVVLAWVKAMLDWATVEPADFRCPTLWLIGSEDKHAMITYIEYEEALKKSKVQVHFVEGLDHNQVFDEVDRVLPVMVDFTKS
jgi:surfactin synthase thioesterase subunit